MSKKSIQNWLRCPNCKNRGFRPTPEVPHRNKCYSTRVFDRLRLRYYVCLQCGTKFETTETINRVITDVRVSSDK